MWKSCSGNKYWNVKDIVRYRIKYSELHRLFLSPVYLWNIGAERWHPPPLALAHLIIGDLVAYFKRLLFIACNLTRRLPIVSYSLVPAGAILVHFSLSGEIARLKKQRYDYHKFHHFLRADYARLRGQFVKVAIPNSIDDRQMMPWSFDTIFKTLWPPSLAQSALIVKKL